MRETPISGDHTDSQSRIKAHPYPYQLRFVACHLSTPIPTAIPRTPRIPHAHTRPFHRMVTPARCTGPNLIRVGIYRRA